MFDQQILCLNIQEYPKWIVESVYSWASYPIHDGYVHARGRDHGHDDL